MPIINWLTFALASLPLCAKQVETPTKITIQPLAGEYDFTAPRSTETQYYDVTSDFVRLDLDGSVICTETYHMQLKCTPGPTSDRYICKHFHYSDSFGVNVSIPVLENWTYEFQKTPTGCDEKGQVFGIDHSRFDQLTDSNGNPLAPTKAYLVYNTFIDFHGFCDEFASPTLEGGGIQDLRQLGQTVIHAAANTQPPTNLGKDTKPGSFYRNGEITLHLKGMTRIGSSTCAIVEFDSGRGTFKMLLEPMPKMNVETEGSSHYFGDIFIDLASNRPVKVDLRELVVSETSVPIPSERKVHAIHDRRTVIKAITKHAYEQK